MHGTRQFLDAQRHRVILLEPLDGADDAMTAALALREINQARPEVAAQYAIVDFALYHRREHPDVLGRIEQLHHPQYGIEQRLVQARDEQAAIGGGR